MGTPGQELRKQYGKKVEKWPEEQQRALRAAQERVYATDAELLFLKVDPNYGDSVADIRRHIEGSKRLHLVETSGDAHLVVEVLARKGTIGPRARNRVLCRVSLGAKAKARRPQPEWAKVEWPGRLYSSEGERIVLHSYSSKEPWWSFLEAERNAWRAVGSWIAVGLDDFAKQNAEALTAVPVPKR